MRLVLAADAPVVSFQKDGQISSTAVYVRRFDGSGWTTIASGTIASYAELGVNNGNLFMALSVAAEGTSPTVLRYIGGASWEPVGRRGFSGTVAYWNRLAFDSSGNPVLAFQVGPMGAVYVWRYTGATWVNVLGDGRASDGGYNHFIHLAMSPANRPVIAYLEVARNVGVVKALPSFECASCLSWFGSLIMSCLPSPPQPDLHHIPVAPLLAAVCQRPLRRHRRRRPRLRHPRRHRPRLRPAALL